MSLTSLSISLLPETFDPFVLKVIKEAHTFIYQHLYEDDGKKIQPVMKKSVQFQPQDGASTVPGTSSH